MRQLALLLSATYHGSSCTPVLHKALPFAAWHASRNVTMQDSVAMSLVATSLLIAMNLSHTCITCSSRKRIQQQARSCRHHYEQQRPFNHSALKSGDTMHL
jgi:hypothetical protein